LQEKNTIFSAKIKLFIVPVPYQPTRPFRGSRYVPGQ